MTCPSCVAVIEGLASELLEGQELEGAPGARSHVALIRSSARSLNGVLEHLSELLKPGSELQVSGTGRLVAPSEVRSARAQPRAAEGALEERGGGLREPQSESEASGRRELAPEAREAGAAAPEPTMHALMDFKMQVRGRTWYRARGRDWPSAYLHAYTS